MILKVTVIGCMIVIDTTFHRPFFLFNRILMYAITVTQILNQLGAPYHRMCVCVKNKNCETAASAS